MDPLLASAIVAECAAASVAVLLARRRAEHLPAAWSLALLAAVGILRRLLAPHVSSTLDAPPAEGAARLAVYIDGAAVLAAVAALPALALSSTSRHPRRAVAGVALSWALASALLAAAYPSPMVRGAALARVYLAADLAALLVTVASLLSLPIRRAPATSAARVALYLAAADVAILLVPLSPWRAGVFAFGARWDLVQVMIAATMAFLSLYQVKQWRSS